MLDLTLSVLQALCGSSHTKLFIGSDAAVPIFVLQGTGPVVFGLEELNYNLDSVRRIDMKTSRSKG